MHGSDLYVTGNNDDTSAIDMSMTQVHGSVLSTGVTTDNTADTDTSTAQDMSFTQMLGGSEALDVTNDATEEMEFTQMHNLNTSVNVSTSGDNTEDMEFTQAHGGILANANTSINDDDDNENDQSVDLAEETMDITQNWGHIVKHLGGSPSGVDDDDNSEESAQVLEHDFQQVLFGANDEKTTDLPSRTKLSQLTQDMASIYEKILNGGSVETEDYSKFSPVPAALNLSDASDASSVDISQDMEVPSPTPVPSSAKRSCGKGEVQSSAKKARSEESEESDEDARSEVMCLKDFLRVGGLQCLDDAYAHLRPKSRDSSFGQASNTDAEWPPQDLREMLEISAVDNIEVQELSEGCLSLVDVTAQIKPQLTSMEEWFNINGASIFNAFSTASPEVLEVEKEKLAKLLEHSRLNAKLAWNIWRVNDTLGLRAKLEDTLDVLQNDVQAIMSLADRAQKLTDYEVAKKQPEFIESQQQVELQKTKIEELLAQSEALKTESDASEGSVTKLTAERDALNERLVEVKQTVRAQKDIQKSLASMQEQFHALTRCTAWRPSASRAPNAGGSFCLEFGAGGAFVLKGSHDDQGRIVSMPTIETTLTDKFMVGLFESAQPALKKCLEKFESSSDVTMVAQTLSTRLGRLEDLRKELDTMKETVTLQPLKKQGALRMLVTSDDGYAQAVLSCNITPAYPFAPLSVRVKVNHLTEESANEHQGLSEKMLREMKAITGYTQLTRMMQKVSQML